MVLFSELQMQGGKHVGVNAGILQVLQLAYPHEQFLIVADSKHYNDLLKKIDTKNAVPYKIFSYQPREDRKAYIIYKTYRQVMLALSLFKKAKKEKARFIVFTSVFPFVAGFLNCFSGFFKQKIIICQHGDLGVLFLKKNRLTTRVFRSAIRSFLKNRNVRYNTSLFYGETIKNSLFAAYPQYPEGNVITIDHPYEYPSEIISSGFRQPVVIANIGNAILAKSSQLFFKLAQVSSDNVTQGKIKFLQIGSLSPEIAPYVNPFVEVLSNHSNFIPADIFDHAVKNADYYIYFFDKGGYYDLCPSGTFFDAIKNAKPIIALRTNWFEYYFDKLGNIGYLCESIEEMHVLINDIANGNRENEHREQVRNLISAQAKLSINNIATIIKPQLIANGF